MKEILLLLLIAFSSTSIFGQDKKNITLFEGGILTYGPATHELGVSFRGIHSVKLIADMYAGIGAGYEKYELNEHDNNTFKIIPLFAQAKYVHRADKSTSIFGAIDLGYGIGSVNKDVNSELEKITFKGGLLASPQIGFVFNTKRRQEFLTFSIGYKYQGATENRYYTYTWPNKTPIEVETGDEKLKGFDNYTHTKYHMHRVSIMLGFGF
ncbi:hypothetical protein [Sphingobacterium bovistauri]|uniref:Outer membrane protein beta-barrel domain-containing protein n=1 Tax=Sphingobacterium bovistauri TaxID=2781959 RepID=A0ABS7Z4X8_9SPHI|nr:hypothetical protein [Sphingobacterium bovistauri]MCA5003940.1 hypothetical protein [Sphingobacterium bovistauri]